jgi:hypothetical protein
MNKEIKDRLDKLENELKESKNEIHSLKSSVSLTIERGIRKLLSRFTRKQLILGSVITLFSISIIGIAGTVTKTYTFSSGDVVSSSKINTNFDALYTLVNGNLDDNNISGISGSKITSGTVAASRLDNMSGSKITTGTVAAARIDNLDGSKITSGTVAAARIDNLDGSKITSGTVASSRIDNLDGSKITSGTIASSRIPNLNASIITSGVFNTSNLPKPTNSIVFFSTQSVTGDFGGRSGGDQICRNNLDNNSVFMFHNNCSNVRALISVDANDEIRDMVANYGVPTGRDLRGTNDIKFGTSWDNITSESFLVPMSNAVLPFGGSRAWGGTTTGGALSSQHCTNFTDASGGSGGKSHLLDPTKKIASSPNNGLYLAGGNTEDWCQSPLPLICICF